MTPKEKAAPLAANPETTQAQATTTAGQRNTIKKIIGECGSLTTLEAREKGIMHPAMRVCELRKQGYDIITSWVYQIDDAGITHRVGMYSLGRGATHA